MPGEAIELRLLGPLRVARGGKPVALPPSRKVRGLLAYLALAPRPQSRSHLCELLWDVPSDPRGELRWCLSRIRGLIDDDLRPRVVTQGDAVELDLADCTVDAREVASVADAGIETLSTERQRRLESLFEGDLLDGLEMDASPLFNGWLVAQRQRLRACHAALLEHLARTVPGDEAFRYLERWRALTPFNPRVHESTLAWLARRGRLREGEEHLAATVTLFEAEGLDSAPLRHAWRAARAEARAETEPVIEIAASVREAVAADGRRRRSIAVMPFTDRSTGARVRGGVADALAQDVITRLAKLRSPLVIAQGTMFALHERGVGAEEAGRILDVDYAVSGSVREHDGRLAIAVELVETRSARIVWAETYSHGAVEVFLILDEIGNRIVAAVAAEIETFERNRAVLKPPSSLDAWEACHRGLWHMYRYRKPDNDQARVFFERSLQLDPTFSRAYAGLSFTHFQNAFQSWESRDQHVEAAYDTAAQALLADERDPAAHWAMGRALFLRRRWDESEAELAHSIDLSPNFALGHYNLSFIRSLHGDPQMAIADTDLSRRLSPFDPMLFGMFGTRAMALVRLEQFADAASWAVKAAGRPNAFPHIQAIAACSLALAGSLDEARTYVAAARRVVPGYRVDDFLATFPFEPQGEALFRHGARLVGMD